MSHLSEKKKKERNPHRLLWQGYYQRKTKTRREKEESAERKHPRRYEVWNID